MNMIHTLAEDNCIVIAAELTNATRPLISIYETVDYRLETHYTPEQIEQLGNELIALAAHTRLAHKAKFVALHKEAEL